MSKTAMIDIENYVNTSGYVDKLYDRNPDAVVLYLKTKFSKSTLLFYGTGQHTRDVLDLIGMDLNIVGIVREDHLDETYIECDFDEPIYKEYDIPHLKFDFIVLLGKWDNARIEYLCMRVNISLDKICAPYRSWELRSKTSIDVTFDMLGIIQTSKPIAVHLAWDSKNDIFSEAGEEISKYFYLIKIYLFPFYFENSNDIYFDKIIRIHDLEDIVPMDADRGVTNEVRLFWLMKLLDAMKPNVIICTKPTVNETLFDYLVMKNKPIDSKFIFAPWGDIVTYKASSFSDDEMMETCACVSLDDLYSLRECEKTLIQESDGVMSSLFGVYKKNVLDKEARNLLTTTFFMHPRYFVFSNREISRVPKLCYTGSLACHNENHPTWALAMDHQQDYECMLKQDIEIDVYTFSHGQHGCYEMLEKNYTGFNLYFNIQHWDLPKRLAGCDFGLIWSNIIPQVAPKLYPGTHSLFLAKAIVYMAAGIPIIVPKEAVLMSRFVETEGIGISIAHDDIANIGNMIRECDYKKLKANVLKYQEKYIAENQPKQIIDYMMGML